MSDASRISRRNSVASLMEDAHKFGPATQRLAEQVAKELGGVVTPLNYKSEASIRRKMDTDGKSPYDIKDSARTTIVFDTQEQVDRAVRRLEERAKKKNQFFRTKKQEAEQFDGYTGNIINLKYGRGGKFMTEIQVNTARRIYGKEKKADAERILGKERYRKIQDEVHVSGGRGHTLYEITRDKTASPERRNKAKRISIKYYEYTK